MRCGSGAVMMKMSSGSAARRTYRRIFPEFCGKIERAAGLMNEHGPAFGADQPGHGHAAAVSAQTVPALAAAHAIDRAATIELAAAFAQAENRAGAQAE